MGVGKFIGRMLQGGALSGLGGAILGEIGDKEQADADAKHPSGGAPSGGKPPSYKKGTKRVSKTGMAKLHKDEAVLNKDEAKHYRAGGLNLGGKKKAPKSAKAKKKIKRTMDEWKAGTLHSGSKKGPKVTSQKQAVAIALDTARRKGLK